MDEIDKEMERMLTLKQVRTFSQYQGITLRDEPEPTIEEKMKDIGWEFSPQAKKQFKRIAWSVVAIEIAMGTTGILGFYLGWYMMASIVIFATLVIFVIWIARRLVEDTSEEEEFKNAN